MKNAHTIAKIIPAISKKLGQFPKNIPKTVFIAKNTGIVPNNLEGDSI